MSELFQSNITLDLEIKGLKEKISSLQIENEQKDILHKEILLEKDNKIKKLKSIIKQKDEEINHKTNLILKNKNFKMVKNFESKLRKAEKKINNLSKSNHYYRSARALSKDRFSKKTKIKEKKRKSDFQNILKEVKEENEMKEEVEEIKKMKKKLSKKDIKKNKLSNIIGEMQKKIEEKDIIKKDLEEDYKYFKDKYYKSEKVVLEVNERLEKFEILNYKLMEEIDEMRTKNENLENLFEKVNRENEDKKKKLNEHNSTNENLALDVNEFYIKNNALLNENELLKEELEMFEKEIIKKEEIFNEKMKVGQNQLNEKDEEIIELKKKTGILIEKNTEYIKNLEKDQDSISLLEDHYKYKFEDYEKLHNKKIKELENQINYFKEEVDKLKKSNLKYSKNFETQPTNTLTGLETEQNGLTGLDYEFDNNFDITNMDLDIKMDKDIKTSILEKSEINDFLDKEEEKSDDEIFHYIHEINEKTSEIQNLRKQLIEATEINNISGLKDEILSFELKIKHLNETIKNNELFFKKEKQLLKDNYENITYQYMIVKLKLTDLSCEKDSIIISFNRKVKKYKYQINIYEEEIKKFNKIMEDNDLGIS